MIENLVRVNIKKLKPYVCARDLYADGLLLDANENPFSVADADLGLNRYPDPHQDKIRNALSRLINIKKEKLFFGVGSDEIIDLLIRIFCEPSVDNALIMEPTYGMYKVACDINNIEIRTVPLNKRFQLDVVEILKTRNDKTKIIFICSPNNPTGELINKKDIAKLCKTNSIIVVDEAYIDFAPKGSVSSKIDSYKNLVVLRTFSKAWGLAGIRAGYCIAAEEIIQYLMKVKAPYSINTLTSNYILDAIKRAKYKDEYVNYLLKEKTKVQDVLKNMKGVVEVYNSDANYILFKCKNAQEVQRKLADAGVIVRDRSNQINLENCLRVTIGTSDENEKFLLNLDSILNKRKIKQPIEKVTRRAVLKRKTRETNITCTVNLDGTGKANIITGIGFFDHLLNQIARHANIDLDINVFGDIEVDEHHIVEDTGIVLGETIFKSLGDKKGIKRYGFLVPMNDSTSYCTIDLSGRAFLNFSCTFKREMVGEMPVELVEEFFVALSAGMKATLSIKAEGRNEHHKIEVIFKSFAKALNEAIRIDERAKGNLPSTKGAL